MGSTITNFVSIWRRVHWCGPCRMYVDNERNSSLSEAKCTLGYIDNKWNLMKTIGRLEWLRNSPRFEKAQRVLTSIYIDSSLVITITRNTNKIVCNQRTSIHESETTRPLPNTVNHRVTQICVGILRHHLFRQWLVACLLEPREEFHEILF